MSWFGETLGGVISTTDLLIYGSYLNTFLLALKAILFVIAEFVVRPKELSKLDFLKRICVSLVPLKDEELIFGNDIKKLKVFRLLWISIFILLGVRLIVGLLMRRLEF